ncbi:IS110 family transposase [Actinopolymorpha pittospori]
MKKRIPFGWAGIDVGKGHHWICLIDQSGTTVWSAKVINDEAAILDAVRSVLHARAGRAAGRWMAAAATLRDRLVVAYNASRSSASLSAVDLRPGQGAQLAAASSYGHRHPDERSPVRITIPRLVSAEHSSPTSPGTCAVDTSGGTPDNCQASPADKVPVVLIAGMRSRRPMLDESAPTAMLAAPTLVRVERLQDLSVEPSDLQAPENGPDVLPIFRSYPCRVLGSTSTTSSHRSSSWLTVAVVRGFRFSSSSCRRRVRTFSASALRRCP